MRLSLARLTGLIWLAWLLTLLAMVGLSTAGTLHPSMWWMAVPLLVQGVATLALLGAGLWRLARGPQRARAARWLVWGLLPTLAIAAYLEHLFLYAAQRNHPITSLVRWALPVSSLLGEPFVRVRYPQRFEGERFVMWSDTPSPNLKEMAAMDAHIRHLEEALGEHSKAKVYWVRGPVWGLEGRYSLGWALGSLAGTSPQEDDDLAFVDRHEVAHFVLHQLVSELTLPAVLSEGWAQYHSEYPVGKSWERTWWAHHDGALLSLRELTSPAWYHNSEGPAYWQGYVLVDNLLRRFGYAKFLELCRNCHEASFAEDLQRTLGLSLDELDQAYLEDFVQQGPPDRQFLLSAQLGPGVEPEHWRRFADDYCASRQRLRELFRQSSFTTIQTIPGPPDQQATPQEGRAEYYLDGPRRGLIQHYSESASAQIVTPDYGFTLRQDPHEATWHLADYYRRDPQEKARDASADHRDPLFLREIDPLRSWGFPRGLTITGLAAEEPGGSRVRVSFELFNPYTSSPADWQGWWLFDTAHDLAFLEMEIRSLRRDGSPPIVWHETVDYGLRDGRYVPTLVAKEHPRGDSAPTTTRTIRLESCQFGPPPDKVFELSNYGPWPAQETHPAPAPPRPTLVWVAGGNLLLALLATFGARRTRPKGQAGGTPSVPPGADARSA